MPIPRSPDSCRSRSCRRASRRAARRVTRRRIRRSSRPGSAAAFAQSMGYPTRKSAGELEGNDRGADEGLQGNGTTAEMQLEAPQPFTFDGARGVCYTVVMHLGDGAAWGPRRRGRPQVRFQSARDLGPRRPRRHRPAPSRRSAAPSARGRSADDGADDRPGSDRPRSAQARAVSARAVDRRAAAPRGGQAATDRRAARLRGRGGTAARSSGAASARGLRGGPQRTAAVGLVGVIVLVGSGERDDPLGVRADRAGVLRRQAEVRQRDHLVGQLEQRVEPLVRPGEMLWVLDDAGNGVGSITSGRTPARSRSTAAAPGSRGASVTVDDFAGSARTVLAHGDRLTLVQHVQLQSAPRGRRLRRVLQPRHRPAQINCDPARSGFDVMIIRDQRGAAIYFQVRERGRRAGDRGRRGALLARILAAPSDMRSSGW